MITNIPPASLAYLLGIPSSTPLDTDEMRKRLRLFFLQAEKNSPRLQSFTDSLANACRLLDIAIVDESAAFDPEGRFKPGIVVIAPGTFSDERLAINRVSTLYNNIIVGIHDEPPPLTPSSSPQEKLNGIVGKLAWEMVHISIYLAAESWTVCTMNGGVVTFGSPGPRPSDVLETLVPKLTAQVVPPRPSDLDVRQGNLPADPATFRKISSDFAGSGKLWEQNDVLLTHTSRESLHYRSPFYRKIVARYLDRRSGMSYGFFARQLPCDAPPAIPLRGEPETEPFLCRDGRYYVPVRFRGEWFLVEPVPVTVIATRSGCRKTRIDPETDLVALCLDRGRITLITPGNLPEGTISRPSFDTLTILSHALGNAFIAALLKTLEPAARFPGALALSGASMTHWHGYPDRAIIPEGYFLHGLDNPPVSCSTPQSAAYSLLGKIEALEQALGEGRRYRGDVHIEPNHGTNIVGLLSLEQTAERINVK